MSLTPIDLGLREALADSERRQAFFRAITQDDIAAQIRSLRRARGLTQAAFAALAGMKQSAVSRIEQAEYASWTLATLFRAASALNARWRITLDPCEEAVKEYLDIETEENVSSETEIKASAAKAFLETTYEQTPSHLMRPEHASGSAVCQELIH